MRAAVFHDVTVGKPQSDIGLGPSVHDRLSCVDRDPHGEVQLGMLAVQLLNCLEHPQSRANRPLGIVAMGDRRAEHRHDGIPDELLHHPAE
jgi:hypothetical protein